MSWNLSQQRSARAAEGSALAMATARCSSVRCPRARGQSNENCTPRHDGVDAGSDSTTVTSVRVLRSGILHCVHQTCRIVEQGSREAHSSGINSFDRHILPDVTGIVHQRRNSHQVQLEQRNSSHDQSQRLTHTQSEDNATSRWRMRCAICDSRVPDTLCCPPSRSASQRMLLRTVPRAQLLPCVFSLAWRGWRA